MKKLKILIIAAGIMIFSGCYSVTLKNVSTQVIDMNLSIIKNSGQIDSFMGKQVIDPYGYKNLCKTYAQQAEMKTLDEYDVRAFYTFCSYEKLCNDTNIKNSSYYKDHVFNSTFCKNKYIRWDLKDRDDYEDDERRLREIRNVIGLYNGTNAVGIYHRAFKYMKRNFSYMSDQEQFPYAPNEIYDVWFVNSERWTIGDCEDWTLKMIWILKDVAKIPTDKLYMVGAFAYNGEGHELPNAKDDKGMIWQLDNMLDAPIPAYYVYKSLGAISDPKRGMGEVLRMDQVKEGWKEFMPEYLPRPCDY